MGSGAGAQNPQLNIVSFSETFNLYYTSRYSAKTLDKIDDFIEHFEKYNLFGDPLKGYPAWTGKVSPSWNVPDHYENKEAIEKYARANKLWHAHLGDPVFKDTFHGKYKVSDWVIHFQRLTPNHIKLLELGYHDPMKLPQNFE
ncbi:hypothetical protein AAGP74_27755 [Klebsiella pneumoniae]